MRFRTGGRNPSDDGSSSPYDHQQDVIIDQSPDEGATSSIKPTIGEASTFAGVAWYDTVKRWVQLPGGAAARDIECDFGLAGDLVVFGASLRGRKHRLLGKPNEDAFALRHVGEGENTFLIVVLCDGLSSAEHSDWSAPWTASRVADSIGRSLLAAEISSAVLIREAIKQAVSGAKTEILSITARRGIADPTSLATTLTVGVLQSAPIPNKLGMFAYIGDSPAFLWESRRWVRIALEEGISEVQSSATDAFPIVDQCRFIEPALRDRDFLLLTSDGIGNYISRNGENLQLGDRIGRRWENPRDEIELIGDLSFDLRSADDDRTAVAIWVGNQSHDV